MKSWMTLVAGVCVCGAAAADEVRLTNGQTLVGITRQESDKVVVQTRLGDLRFPRSEVQSIVPGRTSLHEFEERLEALGTCPPAPAVFELALWAREEGLIRYVNGLLTWTIDLDPDHAQARKLLDFVRYEGKWVLPSERDARIAAKELERKRASAPPAKSKVKRTRPAPEETPYTLGIPPLPPKRNQGNYYGGGFSIWHGVVPTNNLLDLPFVTRIRTK